MKAPVEKQGLRYMLRVAAERENAAGWRHLAQPRTLQSRLRPSREKVGEVTAVGYTCNARGCNDPNHSESSHTRLDGATGTQIFFKRSAGEVERVESSGNIS